MRSFRIVDRQVGYTTAAVTMLVGLLAPGLVPAMASAADVTSRSIELSSSTANASGVSYEVKFTTTGSAAAFVLLFCNDSPVAGQTCTAPSGFVATSAATSTGTYTVQDAAANSVEVYKTLSGGGSADVVLTGIHNPTSPTGAPGANSGFYARIMTFNTTGDADTYYNSGSPSATSIGTVVDSGGVAMAITNNIGVTAAVPETMTFCVSAAAPTADCGGTSAPNVTLGVDDGSGNVALSSSAISTGSVYTQLSTNAAHGAIINLKTSTTGCGGLHRIGASGDCDIKPSKGGDALTTFGIASFGVKAATAATASGAVAASGTLVPSGSYTSSDYYMNYVSGDATGVTSTYGDPFLNSSSAPVNNKNVQLTFGASVSSSTPAGSYAANLSLIATGTY